MMMIFRSARPEKPFQHGTETAANHAFEPTASAPGSEGYAPNTIAQYLQTVVHVTNWVKN